MQHGGKPRATDKPPSKTLKLACPVPGCQTEPKTKQNLNDHLGAYLASDSNGNPISDKSECFKKLSKLKQMHTLYFIENNKRLTDLPKGTVVSENRIQTLFMKVNEKKRRLDNPEDVLPAGKRQDTQDENVVDDPDGGEPKCRCLTTVKKCHKCQSKVCRFCNKGTKERRLCEVCFMLFPDSSETEEELDQDNANDSLQEEPSVTADQEETSQPLTNNSAITKYTLSNPSMTVEDESSSTTSNEGQGAKYTLQQQPAALNDQFVESISENVCLQLLPVLEKFITQKSQTVVNKKSQDYSNCWLDEGDRCICVPCTKINI